MRENQKKEYDNILVSGKCKISLVTDYIYHTRGYDYYKKGNVIHIDKIESIYLANVKGNENYEVTVNLEVNPYQMNCSCPYAANKNCKHMVAVLYCLKRGKIPIKEVKTIHIDDNITDFEKFKKEFKSEYYKLFRNRTNLNTNEADNCTNLILCFVEKGVSYIETNPYLAYEIFEYFILEADAINEIILSEEYDYEYDDEDYYDDQYCIHEQKKRDLIENIFKKFSPLLKNNIIFSKMLGFIEKIYTTVLDDFYFSYDDEILKLTYNSINAKWQATEMIKLLKKLYQNNDIYEHKKEQFIFKKIILTYDFVDKNKALAEAKKGSI